MALGKAVVGYGGTVATTATVTLAENIDLTNYGYIQYNGTKYTSATSFTVNVGDTVTVYAGVSSGNGTSKITLNGEVVATKTAGASTYSLVITGDATISYTWEQASFGYWVTITMDVPAPFAHDIPKGKVLINGVAYDITQGKTLVDGVAYDIAGNTPIAVTITGTGSNTLAYCIINSTTYFSAATDIEVLADDDIQLHIASTSSTLSGNLITIDGEAVVKSVTPSGVTYTWTVPQGTKSINIKLQISSMGATGRRWGQIAVTTT